MLKNYLRNNLNIQAESLAQLKNLAEGLPIIDFHLQAHIRLTTATRLFVNACAYFTWALHVRAAL